MPLLALSRPVKRLVVLVLDITLCFLAVWLAFCLRLENFMPLTSPVIWATLCSAALALPIFMYAGLYRSIFRFSGLPAMMAVCRAILLYGVFFALVFTIYGVEGVPRAVGLIQPIMLFLMVGASRSVARVFLGAVYDHQKRKFEVPQALIYGAGNAGRQLASAMADSSEIRVVGFLDDNNHLHGHLLNGLPIHDPKDLDKLLNNSVITDVLLALPSLSRSRRNEILNALKFYKVAVRTLPSLSDIAIGRVSFSDVRELDIDDLLGRETVEPNDLLLNLNTKDKTVLVTGAGGSIGSELCRQILKTNPKKLLLVEMSEFALYKIHSELMHILAEGLANMDSIHTALIEESTDRSKSPLKLADTKLIPLLASVCDEVRMQEIMSAWNPHTVYHAAAYKHVPLVEHNPVEGIRNNVWGTRVCAEVAMRNGVRNFVLVSTDKAVRPSSIMGATKRLAEMVLQALAEVNVIAAAKGGGASTARTTFSIVRFGNVLDSSGSVVPLFREQIKNGGPITLTHPDVTRYFMTIPEAAQLVIQAGAMGQGGDVFVLNMGEPIKIIDLARRMVELSGLTVRDEMNPDGDIELSMIGLRPGEKLYEELLIGNNPKPTHHARITKAHEQFLRWPQLEKKLNDLWISMSMNSVPVIRDQLQELVLGYQPSSKVVDWVYMAQEHQARANM